MPRSRQTGSRSRKISAGISSSRDAFVSASSDVPGGADRVKRSQRRTARTARAPASATGLPRTAASLSRYPPPAIQKSRIRPSSTLSSATDTGMEHPSRTAAHLTAFSARSRGVAGRGGRRRVAEAGGAFHETAVEHRGEGSEDSEAHGSRRFDAAIISEARTGRRTPGPASRGAHERAGRDTGIMRVHARSAAGRAAARPDGPEAPARRSGATRRPSTDARFPARVLAATVSSYWIGVGVMIARVRRQTRKVVGLVPRTAAGALHVARLGAAGRRLDLRAVGDARAVRPRSRRFPDSRCDEPALRGAALGRGDRRRARARRDGQVLAADGQATGGWT